MVKKPPPASKIKGSHFLKPETKEAIQKAIARGATAAELMERFSLGRSIAYYYLGKSKMESKQRGPLFETRSLEQELSELKVKMAEAESTIRELEKQVAYYRGMEQQRLNEQRRIKELFAAMSDKERGEQFFRFFFVGEDEPIPEDKPKR